MGTITGNVGWVTLTSEAVERLRACLAPLAKQGAEIDKAKYVPGGLSLTSDQMAQTIAAYDEKIASGGLKGVYVHVEMVTNTEGVTETSDSLSNTLSADLLDAGYQSYRITLKAMDARIASLSLQSHQHDRTCYYRLDAPSEGLTELRDQIVAVLTDYSAPPVPPAPAEVPVPPFRVFIGHGGDPQWKHLRRNLEGFHSFEVRAYESEQRAGYHTLVALDQLVHASSVAVVVMTGEDRMEDGELRARENVVHEVGFAQGVLGLENTIILLEHDVSEFSNIAGMTQIRFPRGDLLSIENDVVEVLNQRREAHELRHGRRG